MHGMRSFIGSTLAHVQRRVFLRILKMADIIPFIFVWFYTRINDVSYLNGVRVRVRCRCLSKWRIYWFSKTYHATVRRNGNIKATMQPITLRSLIVSWPFNAAATVARCTCTVSHVELKVICCVQKPPETDGCTRRVVFFSCLIINIDDLYWNFLTLYKHIGLQYQYNTTITYCSTSFYGVMLLSVFIRTCCIVV